MSSLPIVFGYHIDAIGNSSVPYALCNHWNENGFASTLYGPSCADQLKKNWLKVAMGRWTRKLAYRIGEPETARIRAEKLALAKVSQERFVYLWAGLSLEIFREFKSRGKTLILERINCHQETAKRILEQASADLGLHPDHKITEESIAKEREKLALADAIFCPSPEVRRSLLENGVEESKLLSTSYGWAPERFPEREPQGRPGEKPTFLFVGTLCVRKGLPLLLAAWEEAAIDGRLICCGHMDDTIRTHWGHHFDRPDIHHVPYSPDLSPLYRQADCFVCPSLEEGGPMVTYEAMAHGLLPLVSAMGGGTIVEHQKNGLIIPHSVSRWADAIRAVASNPTRRQDLAAKAKARAEEFTWPKVAMQRAHLLLEKFPELSSVQKNSLGEKS